MSEGAGLAAAVVALVFWGGTAIANRYAVEFADPVAVATLRSMLAGVIALIVSFLLKFKFPAGATDRIILIVSGLCSFAIWPLALSLGLARTTASHAALIMAILPVLTVLMASAISRILPRAAWWFGGALAFIATVVLIFYRGETPGSDDPGPALIGDLIILGGTVLCAVGYVAGARLTPKIGSFATTFWGLAIALPVTAPVFLIYQQATNWSTLPTSAWWAIAWLTLLSSLLGYVLWFFALGRDGIEKVGSLQLMMPVVTLVGAVVVLGEILTLPLIGLSALILLGTIIAHRASAR